MISVSLTPVDTAADAETIEPVKSNYTGTVGEDITVEYEVKDAEGNPVVGVDVTVKNTDGSPYVGDLIISADTDRLHQLSLSKRLTLPIKYSLTLKTQEPLMEQ